jgi:crotonobetainyl-CoA:carnitine CoA-transferase CaiB-like acyl-CoA transferase
MSVLEVGDERGEFCGRLLVGAGADVIKIEPLTGSQSRRIGPFRNDVADVDESLFFWHYNLGKRSVTLDLEREEGSDLFARLVERADIVLDSNPPGKLAARGFDLDRLTGLNPALIVCAITPFGQTGPYRDFKSSDLVHLALGGQMMVCGYEPVGDFDMAAPSAAYDSPPIAPQMWHAYHISGAQAALAITSAVFWRLGSGKGEYIDLSIHEACAACTEMAVPMWIYEGQRMYRQTGRHAWPVISQPSQHFAGDGNWVVAKGSMGFPESWDRFVGLLKTKGLQDDLEDPRYRDVAVRSTVDAASHIAEIIQSFLATCSSEEAMELGQAVGMAWAAVRRPEENARDAHWLERGLFQEIEHPELGESYPYVAAPWVSTNMPWVVGERPPRLGEHNSAVYREILGMGDRELADLKRLKIV